MLKAKVLTGEFWDKGNQYGAVGHKEGDIVKVYSLKEAIEKEPAYEGFFKSYYDHTCTFAYPLGFIQHEQELFPVFINDIEFEFVDMMYLFQKDQHERYVQYLMKALQCEEHEAQAIYETALEEAKEYDSPLEFCIQLAVSRLC